MKRLLVVDDEAPVVEGIRLIVERDLADEFVVAGHASSGREAIEKVLALVPDIVLMDVRMPGISGIDAIRSLRERGSTALFILVTAYERFDIAKEAVGLGVRDYLLKPVSKEQLAKTLREAASHAERLSEAERAGMEGREASDRLRALAETALFHGIMLGADLVPELPGCRKALGLDQPAFLVGAAQFRPRPEPAEPGTDSAALHARFEDFLRYKTSCLCGPLVRGRSVLLLGVRSTADAEGTARDCQAALAAAFAAEFAEGLVSVAFARARPLEEAGLAWREASLSLLGWRHQAQGPGGPEGAVGARDDAKPYEDEDAFQTAVGSGDGERARALFERLVAKAEGSGMPRASAGWLLGGLLSQAARLLCRRGLLSVEDSRLFLDGAPLATASERGVLSEAARDQFSLLLARMSRNPRHSPPVAKAMAFIEESYGRQIGLESAADHVGLTPGRLSRLFVEETGKGFSDYLIDYRIEKAREMLLSPGATIKSVSLACGYPDPNYFSRLFKKVTGLTPSSFSSGSPVDSE